MVSGLKYRVIPPPQAHKIQRIEDDVTVGLISMDATPTAYVEWSVEVIVTLHIGDDVFTWKNTIKKPVENIPGIVIELLEKGHIYKDLENAWEHRCIEIGLTTQDLVRIRRRCDGIEEYLCQLKGLYKGALCEAD
jgi:hypothetical protein